MTEGSWALLNWDVKNTQRVVGYEIVGYIPVVPHKAVAEVSKIGNL